MLSLIKKLFFAIPFQIFFIFFLLQLDILLKSPFSLFSIGMDVLVLQLTLISLLFFTSLSFVIFITLASDWRFVMPVILITSVMPIIFLSPPYSLLLTFSIFISFGIIFFLLQKELQSYLTFQPTHLLQPSIKRIVFSVILLSSVAFYLAADIHQKQYGFSLPDELFESFSKFLPSDPLIDSSSSSLNLDISSEQISLLQQNPDLLKQFGVENKVAKQTPQLQFSPTQIIKQQTELLIKPYTQFIPAFLAFLFFVTLSSLSTFLALLITPLLWFIFYLLEKSGYVRFEKELREIKKLVV